MGALEMSGDMLDHCDSAEDAYYDYRAALRRVRAFAVAKEETGKDTIASVEIVMQHGRANIPLSNDDLLEIINYAPPFVP